MEWAEAIVTPAEAEFAAAGIVASTMERATARAVGRAIGDRG